MTLEHLVTLNDALDTIEANGNILVGEYEEWNKACESCETKEQMIERLKKGGFVN